jgi:MOSC domain-containing protein YiiM
VSRFMDSMRTIGFGDSRIGGSIQRKEFVGVFGKRSWLANWDTKAIMGLFMSPMSSPARVVSLHLHPVEPATPLQSVDEISVVAGKGIFGEPRYFGKISRRTGNPSRRQVSLIEREQIAEHAAALGLESIPPGAVRANIETEGINLMEFLGKQIKIGEAILLLYEARLPCGQMDAICTGLRALMENNRQGVMAEVIQSGVIRRQDSIVCEG